jgi:hypothetical protein
MKNTRTFFPSLLVMSSLVASAQQSPKLAIAAVEASPSLAKRNQPEAPAKGGQSSEAVDMLQGRWNANFQTTNSFQTTNKSGIVQYRRTSVQWTVIFGKSQDGSIKAEIEDTSAHTIIEANSVLLNGNHVKLTFPDDANGATRFLEGDIFTLSKRISAVWHVGDKTFPVALNRFGSSSFSDFFDRPPRPSHSASAKPPALAVSLKDVIHAIDVRLVDRFGSADMFTVVEDSNLKQMTLPVSGKTDQRYNLKDPNTAEQFKQAGINYLLVTTIEEFQEQTLDLSQEKGTYQTGNVQQQYSTRSTSVGGVQKSRTQSGSRSSVARQGESASRVTKQQILYFTVRCRLFDATSGELLESENHSFSTNRTYAVLAQGDTILATTYLLDELGKAVSEWEVIKTIEAAYPIKVLEKEGRLITINRGSEVGVKVGKIYDVYTAGKQIKDPATGEILGRDEVKVGRVGISEIRQKFSKATVYGEDKGIAPGAVLRRVLAN